MERDKAVELSVVIPLYCEEQTIPELYGRLINSVQSITNNYEILFVNDGSYDGTLTFLKKFAAENPCVKYISFSRNFGHQNAIAAGLKHVSGSIIVTMDGDLQDPPELIPELYAKYHQGYKVVYAKRISRKGESLFKRSTAKFFYRLMRRITAVDIPLDTGDFRIMSREVVNHLNANDETNRFFRGTDSLDGIQNHSGGVCKAGAQAR
jgi:dolichol-phosphate mannosyltransferase